jgi:hypothetical protein
MDDAETQYALRGSVDEVKVWDKEIPVTQVEQLKNQWATPTDISDFDLIARIYPNPAEEFIYIEFTDTIRAERITLFASDGREDSDYQVNMQDSMIIIKIPQNYIGLHLLRMNLKDGRVVTRKIVIR